MRRISRGIALQSLLCVFGPIPLIAQLQGVVLDPNGTPLVGASVTVWAASTERAHTLTGPRGTFTFSEAQLSAVDGISARAIGYRPLTLRWSRAESALRLTLEPFPAPLPELVASGLKIQCPAADDPEARVLWSRLRTKYDLVPQSVGLNVRMSWIRETTSEKELGSIDESRLSSSPGGAGLHGSTRELGYRFLNDSGYAQTRRDSHGAIRADLGGAYFEWWYPSFQRWQPDHFVEAIFGRLQFLAFGPQVGGLPTILFCSRNHRRPYVSGALLLASDSTIAESAWQFYTDKRRENAGGHAWYLPPGKDGAAPHYLLPAMSVFWRQRGGQKVLYFHESAINHEWIFGPDAEIPRLPSSQTPPGA